MNLQPTISKAITGILALAVLAMSVSCICPGYWGGRGGGGWHGSGR